MSVTVAKFEQKGGRDDSKLMIPTTVLCFMFSPPEVRADEDLRAELVADFEDECGKQGPVESVKEMTYMPSPGAWKCLRLCERLCAATWKDNSAAELTTSVRVCEEVIYNNIIKRMINVEVESKGFHKLWIESESNSDKFSGVKFEGSSGGNLGLTERAFSAVGAAFLSTIIDNPLDLAKTRLHAQAAGVQYSHPLSNLTSSMAFFGPNMEALEVIVSDLVLSSAINSSVFQQEALEDKVSDQIFGSAISTSVFQATYKLLYHILYIGVAFPIILWGHQASLFQVEFRLHRKVRENYLQGVVLVRFKDMKDS
ncbi:hypothetical protein AgCh_026666 [Apium graveolens]